jgi:phage gpG-like protein
MANIKVQVDDKEFQEHLKKLLHDMDDMRPLWRLMPLAYAQAERDLFATDGFGRWPEHSYRYEFSKWKREHSPGQLLVGTGTFRAQMTTPAAKTDYKNRTVFQAWSPLANIHQYRKSVKNRSGTYPLKGRGKRRLYPVTDRSFKRPFLDTFIRWGETTFQRDWEGR